MQILNSAPIGCTTLSDKNLPSGWFKINADQHISDVPSGYSDGIVFILKTSDSNILQIAIPFQYANIYIRTKWGNEWLAWRKIPTSAL